jgi:hypothetical protein
MANEDHLARLRQGVEAWNAWRKTDHASPDLREAGLADAKLSGANLLCADLSGANLVGANLSQANLVSANLSSAKLVRANLSRARLVGANLGNADLSRADLSRADLSEAFLVGALLGKADLSEALLGEAKLGGALLTRADLSKANLQGALLLETLFVNLNLATTRGLDGCVHLGPNSIDVRTLQRSGPLPLAFLRGCGLPDKWIESLPSLLAQPIQHYSCFISYSSKDQDFADRLHADLQNKGVRCWFAPHDLPVGAKTWDAIDEAIKLRDKLLLILSENSIASDWVEDEVSKAFAEERDRKLLVLFPVRIDNAVMATAEPWAVKLRDQRNIGDFREWKEHDGYGKSLERLLRDLKMPASNPSG